MKCGFHSTRIEKRAKTYWSIKTTFYLRIMVRKKPKRKVDVMSEPAASNQSSEAHSLCGLYTCGI